MTDLRLIPGGRDEDDCGCEPWPFPRLHWWDRLLAWLFAPPDEPIDRKNIP